MSEIKTIGYYRNGNYTVTVLEDGTKIRRTEDDEFRPAFAENCDCKITDRCDGNCNFCYENCTPNGKHGDILNYKFLDSLHPHTELAINGNDLSHPDLIAFLQRLKDKKIITNMTVNQIHFEKNIELIDKLIEDKLINGLGISLKNPSPEFIRKVRKYPNAVIHVINGVITPDGIRALADNKLKMLILGYKTLRRGMVYYECNKTQIEKNQTWLKNNLKNIIGRFNIVSFDNLAIEQLDVKSIMSESEWERFYMGDDGNYTFYIDMVKGKFSKNSIADDSNRYDINDMTIDEMFDIIRKEPKTA